MSVTVVVPCYKSATTIPILVKRLLSTFRDEARYGKLQIILVADGGAENTWAAAHELANGHSCVEAILLARNYGQHNALLAGIRAASGDVIVTMDDDLQHIPEEVPTLLDALTDDTDLVYGSPVSEEHGRFRSAASRMVKWGIARSLGWPSATQISAFRAFRTPLREGMAEMSGPHASVDVALSWTTTRIAAREVQMDARAEGRSNYSFRMLVRHATNMLLGYGTAPLRLVGYIGAASGAFGVLLLALVLWRYFIGNTTVPGFTTLASMIAIFSGAQMVAIGVLGEYLARIHTRTMGKPTYVIRETTLDGHPGASPGAAHAQ